MAYANAVPLVKCSICGAVQWLSDECEVCESKLVLATDTETLEQKVDLEKIFKDMPSMPSSWDSIITCFDKTSMVDSSNVSEALEAFWKSAEVSTGISQDKMYVCSTSGLIVSDVCVKNAAVIDVK